MPAFSLLLFLWLSPPPAAQARTITLEEAVRTAQVNQPQIRQAHANTVAGAARADEARAPLLPEAKLSAQYERTTGNRVHKPGSSTTTVNSTASFNWYDFTASGDFILWDFGQTRNRWRAAVARAQGLGLTEDATGTDVVLNVRSAYFRARAQKSLAAVAREALDNQDRHLGQITGFVTAGTRPQIDLAQARADRAAARVQLINAENGYVIGRAQLNQAMGVTGGIDYEVEDEGFPAVDVESQPTQTLIDEALRARKDIAGLDSQIRGQELTGRAIRDGYWPTISLVGGAATAGTNIIPTTGIGLNSSAVEKVYTDTGLAWNYFGGINLLWPFFQGFLTGAQAREADAILDGLRAQRDALVQQVWVSVQQAQLGVRAAEEALLASNEGLTNARERLTLAEGRYEAGAGSVIELGDAQLGTVTAGAQKVGAEYNLASARAELLHALGRR